MSGTLHVVGTPIGNLEDITLRALRVLHECDAVVAEDSRRTRALLTAHGLRKPVLSLTSHDEARRIPDIVRRLDDGASLALCTDAGTPVVSDPGALLVRTARSLGHAVVAIPGPSAVTTALSVSGLSADSFCFLGFLPRTPSKQRRVVESALQTGRTLVFFESPLRLARTLRTTALLLGERQVLVARELTKLHETVVSGTAAELAASFAAQPPRGECTVLVAGA
ncbi:MAG: 16S rRNA (cytidine(1402)-2'-O)-methyltransferase [Candidatus Dormibacteraeota bacterium]|nr:16S rRNA (cytidine(1402)-2'-O)-methyltransferase [Candidatus Dormibacteraeota bacterium]